MKTAGEFIHSWSLCIIHDSLQAQGKRKENNVCVQAEAGLDASGTG